MRIGLLTGGGDSPAINGAIRAVVRRAYFGAHTVYGFEQGWLGVLDNFGYEPFDSFATAQLFRIVSARHLYKPILLAASTGFKKWSNLFPSEEQAVATVDRLIDRATILRFTGKPKRKPKEIYGAESD